MEDPSLLRAARLAGVLRNCGRIFASNTGTAHDYMMSKQVEHVDVFLSHNWSVGRVRKFVQLAVHFNLDLAIGVAVVALAASASAGYALGKAGYWGTWLIPVTHTATMAAFTVALFFGHEARALWCCKDRRIFLDKLCISQTDAELKHMGILSLGAVLYNSRTLLLCFTDLYLKKLWTVYEFGTFLLMHGEARPRSIHVSPTNLPLIMVATMGLIFVGVLIRRTFVMNLGLDLFLGAVLTKAIAAAVVTPPLRLWARQQEQVRLTFQRFTFADTTCAMELDRVLVRRNIVTLMRHYSLVQASAPDEEALQAFEELFRAAGWQAFLGSVGTLGCTYKLVAIVLLPVLTENVIAWAVATSRGDVGYRTASQVAFMLLSHLAQCLAVIPLAFALVCRLTRCCLRLRGIQDVAYCAAVVVLFAATLLVLDPQSLLRPLLLDRALHSVSSSAGFVVYSAGLFVATACMYCWPWWQAKTAAGSPGRGLPLWEGPRRHAELVGPDMKIDDDKELGGVEATSELFN